MANEVGKAYVTIIPSMRGFSNAIRRQIREELRDVDTAIKANVDFDAHQVATEAAEAIKAAQAAVPDLKGVAIDVDRDGLIRKVSIAAKAAEKAAPEIKLKTGIDEKRLVNFLGNLGGNPLRALGEAAEDVTRFLSGGLTQALGGASQAGAQLVATSISLVAVTGALLAVFLALAAVIGGALAVAVGTVVAGLLAAAVAMGVALPAAALAAVPAVAALMFMFDTFGKLVSAITEGDLKKFDKFLGTLTGKTLKFAEAFRPLVNLKDEVQEKFFGAVLEGFEGKLPGAVNSFKNVVLDLTGTFGAAAKQLVGVFRSAENQIRLQQVLGGLKVALDGILSSLTPLTQAFLKVGAAGAAEFGQLGKILGKILGNLADSLGRLVDDGIVDRILDAFNQLVDVAGTELVGIFETLALNAPAFLDVLSAMLPVFQPLIAAFSEFLKGAAPGFVAFMQALTELFQDPAFVQSMTDFGIAMSDLFVAVIPLIPLLIPLLNFFTGLVVAVTLATGALLPFLSLFQAFADFVGSIFFGDAITQFDLLRGAVDAAKFAISFLDDAALAAVTGALAAFSGLPSIGDIATAAMNAAVGAVQAATGSLRSAAIDAVDQALDGFRTGIDDMPSIGRALVQGMINGINAMVRSIGDAAASLVTGAIDRAKAAAGMKSPSKVMREVGVMFSLGFALGIPEPGNLVNAAAARLVSDAVAAATAVPTNIPLSLLSSSVSDALNFDFGLDDSDRDKKVVLVADGVEIARLVNKKNKDLSRR